MTPQDLASTHAAAFTQSRPWTPDEFADLLANPVTQVVGNVRCFALFRVIEQDAELLTIATHPAYQRQGLALRCMKAWHARAVGLGAKRAVLDVAADNDAALGLYERCRYRRCGLRKSYYLRNNGNKCDAVVMECSLP